MSDVDSVVVVVGGNGNDVDDDGEKEMIKEVVAKEEEDEECIDGREMGHENRYQMNIPKEISISHHGTGCDMA